MILNSDSVHCKLFIISQKNPMTRPFVGIVETIQMSDHNIRIWMLTIWLRFNEVIRVFFNKFGLNGFGTIVTEDNLINITSPTNPMEWSFISIVSICWELMKLLLINCKHWLWLLNWNHLMVVTYLSRVPPGSKFSCAITFAKWEKFAPNLKYVGQI